MNKIIGVGKTGVRLLDALMSLDLREALEAEEKRSSRDLRFIAVETDIGELAGSNADTGFYLGTPGDCSGQQEAIERMSARGQQALAHELRGACLILLLVETGDALECAAAAGIAELADRAGAMSVSLVARPNCSADTVAARSDDDQMARIRAASDVVLTFRSDEQELIGDACFTESGEPVPAGKLINCAHTLLKAITLPYQQLVACDYQDIRTVLDTPLSLESGLAGQETAFFYRIVATPDTPAEEISRIASETLPLKEASKVLIYLEGTPQFSMERVRDLVCTIKDELNGQIFVKYCVERNSFRQGAAEVINFVVNVVGA